MNRVICKHNVDSVDGCKLCWKERAEKAQAACAEMRRLIVIAAEGPGKDWLEHQAMLCDWLVHHDNSSCGVGWLSPDKRKLLVEALEALKPVGGCWCEAQFSGPGCHPRHTPECDKAQQALAAVKGEQK